MTGSDWMPTSYYDAEAELYDERRGGEERARATAAAIATLAPEPGLLLDAAGGTGAVSAALADLGWAPAVIDLSAGMLALAARRLPGRVLQASADRLPVRDDSVDLVTVIWMFNLVSPATVDAVIVEAARVLRPGGRLVVSVDKELAHDPQALPDSDADARVTTVATSVGLVRVGSARFTGQSVWGSATADDPEFRLAAFGK